MALDKYQWENPGEIVILKKHQKRIGLEVRKKRRGLKRSEVNGQTNTTVEVNWMGRVTALGINELVRSNPGG